MDSQPQSEDIIQEWREGRIKARQGFWKFLAIAVLACAAGVAILLATGLDYLGFSVIIIGVLILGLGVAAKA
jgi:hypothetical protein